MPTVTLEGMPEALYRRLTSRAKERGWNLNDEILSCLESAVYPRRIDVETWLRRAADARSRVKRPLTDLDLEA